VEWILLALAAPLLAVAAVLIWARLLPVHLLSRRVRDLPHRPEQVWQVLTDFEHHPAWRSRVRSVSRVPSAPQEELWRENYGRMGLTLRTEIEEPGRVLVRRVAGTKMDFSGSWRFEVEPLRAGGCRVTLTEMAEYYRPMHRLMARLLEGEGRNIEQFLVELDREMARQNPQAVLRPGLARA
jgi:uncharacterized membrane protein